MLLNNWQTGILGDFIELQRGYDLPKRERKEGNVPIVSSAGVTGSHAFSKVKGPGVVTGRYGTLGKVIFIKRDFWPLNTTLYVKDFKGNDPLFLGYFLRTLNLENQNTAGAVPGVNRNALHLLPVRMPPLETQSKIASILSAYDNLIENNTRRIKILEEMARMIYREWFVNFRFPGHEKVKMVDSPLGRIPEGWEVIELQKICDRITDGSHKSPESRSEGYPMASVKDMHDYGLTIHGCRKISEEDYIDLVRNDCKVKKDWISPGIVDSLKSCYKRSRRDCHGIEEEVVHPRV